MKLDQLENILDFQFPKKWKEIHSTGVMEWVEQSLQEFRENKEKYINDPKCFFMLDSDCEPLFFDDIPKRLEELKEWISWREEDDNVSLKEGVKLIPFAQNGGGDLYCFLEEGNVEEPQIVLYYHDDYTGPVLEANSFDEFIYVTLLASASWSEDIDNDSWKAHYQLLNDEYKRKIDGRTAEELADEYESTVLGNVDIWKN